MGAELGERRQSQLIKKNQAMILSPCLQLLSEEEFTCSLAVFAEMARFLIITKTLNGVLNRDSFSNAWLVGIGDVLHSAGVDLRFFPTARFCRFADEVSIGQCSLNPFGAMAAPIIDIGIQGK